MFSLTNLNDKTNHGTYFPSELKNHLDELDKERTYDEDGLKFKKDYEQGEEFEQIL